MAPPPRTTPARFRTAHWIQVSFAAAVGLTVAVLLVAGPGEQGTILALKATARLAFLPFWFAYAGAALVSLFGPALKPLPRHARELGLSFAAIECVHLALVAWLCLLGHPPGLRTFLVFGTAILFVGLLTLCSISSLRARLGKTGWWLLRVIGMNYVAYAFAIDFLRGPLAGGLGHAVFYWPFAALAIIGPGLRVAALAQGLARPTNPSPAAMGTTAPPR
ncbi:hypothetical protein [Rhodopila sp.]|uniref:hypothetical protein n=1 Tax=Rhodopila sp. TaxID=2480087 RepID=UPI003D0FDA3E